MRCSIKTKLPRLIKTCNILLFLITLLFSGCNGYYTSWENDKEIHGIEFRKIRYGLVKGDTLAIIGYLEADSKINGYQCAADWIHFNKAGSVQGNLKKKT